MIILYTTFYTNNQWVEGRSKKGDKKYIKKERRTELEEEKREKEDKW